MSSTVHCSNSGRNGTPSGPNPPQTNQGNDIEASLKKMYEDAQHALETLSDPAERKKYEDKLQSLANDYINDPAKIVEYTKLYELLNTEHENIPVGIAIIVVGLFLAFVGRRLFKAFLTLSGFLIGASATLYLMVLISELLKFIIDKPYYWGLAIVGGILGALLFNRAWKSGMYALSAYGGVMVGIWALGMLINTPVMQYIDRTVFLIVCGVIGFISASYVDELSIIASSSLAGATAIVFGYDMIQNNGFRTFIRHSIDAKGINLTNEVLKEFSIDNPVRSCFIVVLFITIVGIYVQYRYQPRSFDKE